MRPRHLELKVPPVLSALVFALLMWLVSLVLPGISIISFTRWPLIIILCIAGAFFPLAAVYSFKKASTTVHPLKPEKCTTLVTSGIYRWSRNPMYFGLLCVLIAWGLILSNLYSMIFAAGFLGFMNLFQIKPEERVLLGRFGQTYADYMKRVRRWL